LELAYITWRERTARCEYLLALFRQSSKIDGEHLLWTVWNE